MTARAEWNGVLLAESDETIIVEGNHYFPPAAVKREYFEDSATQTLCPWKGHASYLSIAAGGRTNLDAAWYYPDPHEAAAPIKDYVSFWHGVEVSAGAADGTPGPAPG
jgi:uncharacterized protein (DUF427 family)